MSCSERGKTAFLSYITNLRPGRGARRFICFINAERAHDYITRRVIDVKQQLLVAQNTKEDVGSLMEELATPQSERKSDRESLGLKPMNNGPL